jgi:excisionase family DNA binding protein
MPSSPIHQQGKPDMSQIFRGKIPIAADINLAMRLLHAIDSGHEVRLRCVDQQFVLSPGLVGILRELLMITANGDAVIIIPSNAELTFEQTAEHLNVSVQFVQQEASAGHILSHTVGTHRRFKFSDVLEYERRMQRRSLEARRALSEQGQELGLDG